MKQPDDKQGMGSTEPGLDSWIIEDLNKSGLTSANFSVEPLRSEKELKERLGVTRIKGKSGKLHRIIDIGGYWIPYPNIPGYYRLKLKRAITDSKGNKRKYLSPLKKLNKSNHTYVPSEVSRMLSNYSPDKPIYITEGEKKAAKATLEGFPCIGLGGVWMSGDKDNDFLPELDQYIWKDRTVYICFDSDINEKHSVKHAELRLAIKLINRGAIVCSVRLPNLEVEQ
jgi:uncharacterized protein DUF3854